MAGTTELTVREPVSMQSFEARPAAIVRPFVGMPVVEMLAGPSYYDQLVESATYPGLWS